MSKPCMCPVENGFDKPNKGKCWQCDGTIEDDYSHQDHLGYCCHWTDGGCNCLLKDTGARAESD